MPKLVIDVSQWQGVINWEAVKPHIDGAIIRAGYGSDIAGQDDVQFARNAEECERLGIPWGAYLYSYANSTEKINSEIQHMLRLLKGHKPQLPVYYDLEETRYQSMWPQAAELWCKQIRAAGYIDGLYSWAWALNNLTTDCSSFWACDYGVNDGRKHRMPQLAGGRELAGWQYTSKGHIDGISGNGLDVSEFYSDFVIKPVSHQPQTATPRIDLEIQCLHRGRSGKKVGGGEICMYDDAVVGLSIGATLGSIEYRVHKIGGGWFSRITKCDWGTPDAYAGDLHSMIDGVQIYFHTDPKLTGGKYYRVQYQVKTQHHGWLGGIYDTDFSNGDGNTTAGIFGDPIIGIRAKLV